MWLDRVGRRDETARGDRGMDQERFWPLGRQQDQGGVADSFHWYDAGSETRVTRDSR